MDRSRLPHLLQAQDSLTCRIAIKTDRLLSFNGREPQRGANTRNRHSGVHPICVGLLSRELARPDRPVSSRQEIVSHFPLIPPQRERSYAEINSYGAENAKAAFGWSAAQTGGSHRSRFLLLFKLSG